MSGAYIVQKENRADLHELARLLSSALSYGGEYVNHYCSHGQTVMGLVGNDKFRKGVMPVYIPSERLWVVLMGELYESDGLTSFREQNPDISDDAEVFARLFRRGDLIKALPDLNGAFFVMLFDPLDDTVIAANDRYGLYPMYWSRSADGFCLASRVICPVISGVADGEWDLAGVAQFLALDDFLGETTLVSGVSTFPQASVLIKKDGSLSWQKYWSYRYIPDDHLLPEKELAEELGQRFLKAVKAQTRSARRIGVTLSGGLDSRVIVAAASHAGIPVRTFTWGKPGSYDRIFAGQVSRLYRTEHHDCDYACHNLQTRFFDGIRITEGLINYFDCHMLFHLHILKEHADLILNGYAGDLVLGGSYLRSAWMSPYPNGELAGKLFAWRNTLVPESSLAEVIPDFPRLERQCRPSMLYQEMISRLGSGLPPADAADTFFLENRVRRSTAMGTVLMRETVESASCFFDYPLLDLITAIPYTLRHEHRMYREMLKYSFPESLRVRWQRTLLPAYTPSAMDLPVKAFLKGCRILENNFHWPHISSRQAPVDFSILVRGILRPWMDSIIYDTYPLSDQILNPDFCEQIWNSHLAGENHIRLLGVIASIRGFSSHLRQARSKTTSCNVFPVEIR